MSRLATALAEEAAQIATRMNKRDADLQDELLKIEKRKAEIEAERNKTRLAPQRLLEFEPKIGVEYNCPSCWINNETRTPLSYVADAKFDHAYCGVCPFEIKLPLRG